MKFFVQLINRFFFPVSIKYFPDYCFSWMVISGISLPIIWLILRFAQFHIRTYWLFVFATALAVAYSYIFRSSDFRLTEFKLSPKLILSSALPILVLITLLILADDYAYGFNHPRLFGLIAGLTCVWSAQVAIVIRLLIENLLKIRRR